MLGVMSSLKIYMASWLLIKAAAYDTSTSYENLKQLDDQYSLCLGWEIREVSIIEAQSRFFRGVWSSEALTRCYIRRIKALDPMLRSVLEINPDAIKIARGLDKRFNVTRKLVGPLHGIPILIKDTIGTQDRMNTTGGSIALLSTMVERDAVVVAKLRKAGAIILGKNNLSELGGIVSMDAPEGWSARGGQVVNPYDSRLTVSGSSSGSAVAVASNLCMASLGTETVGSLVYPATMASVVAIKPGRGGTTNKGVIPLSPSRDVVGSISRKVDDGLIVMSVIAQPSLKRILSSVYIPASHKPTSPFKSTLNKGMRLGVVRSFYHESTSDIELKQLQGLLNNLSSKFNVTIVDDLEMDLSYDDEMSYRLFVEEFNQGISDYLTKKVSHIGKVPILSLSDICHFNNLNTPRAIEYGQDMLNEIMQQARNLTHTKQFKTDISQFVSDNQAKFDELMVAHRLDGLISPSYLSQNKVVPLINPYASAAGYPVISVPIGTVPDLEDQAVHRPIGLSVVGAKQGLAKLIQLARFIEKSTDGGRFNPKFNYE